MAQENRTQFAILGMLSIEPMSGYDIKKAVDGSVAFFWKENFGRLYPVLAGLEKSKLIRRERIPMTARKVSAGRPARKLFSITEAGRNALDSWLRKPHAPPYFRIELLLKLFFGINVPKSVSIAAVEKEKRLSEEVLSQLEAVEAQIRKAPPDPQNFFGGLTANYGKKYYSAVIEWCDETIRSLKSVPDITWKAVWTRRSK